MRSTYRVLAGIIALGVVAQASFVALGWFLTLNEIDDGQLVDKAYLENDGWNIGHTLHGIVGFNLMPLLGLILLIVSFFAKIPGGVKWAGLTFLAIIVQVVLGLLAFGVGGLGALHGINAFVVLGLALFTGRRVAMTTSATTSTEKPEAAAV
ncbi:MAG: hypothetical protein ACRDV1_09085 [Actinomycetes bacterium]